MTAHACAEPTGCRCSSSADEPNEDCPVHGAGPWPPRCGECGKFLPWSVRLALPFHVELAREPECMP